MRIKVVTTSNNDSAGKTYYAETSHQEYDTAEALASTAYQTGILKLKWSGHVVLIPWHQVRYISYEPVSTPAFVQDDSDIRS